MTVKKTGKDLVKWEEEFANMAKAAAKKVVLPSAKSFSIRGGQLTFGGVAIPNNELRAVIVGFVYENQYYVDSYDPDSVQTPVCYAFGTDEDEMAPSEDVHEQQCGDCASCPMNQWDSGPNGKGKACKNVLRLALISEEDLENIEEAEIASLKIPVTSRMNFLAYFANDIAKKLSRPIWSVVTEVTVKMEPYPKVYFKFADKITDSKLFAPLKELNDRAIEELSRPYPEYVPPAPKVAKGKPKPTKFGRK